MKQIYVERCCAAPFFILSVTIQVCCYWNTKMVLLWFRLFVFFVWLSSAMVSSAFTKFKTNGNIEANDVFYIPIFPEEKVLDLLTFSIENIIKIYEAAQIEKSQEELIAHFENMKLQLEGVKESIHNVYSEIEELEITAYSNHEEAIVESLDTYRDYVSQPDNKDLQKDFFKQAGTLRRNIRGLMNGLLGRYQTKGDILIIMRNILACHGRKLQEKTNSLMNIVMTGVWLHFEYKQIINATDLGIESSTFQDDNIFKDDLIEMSNNLTRRLDEEVFHCRMDESNISEEINRIVMNNTYAQQNRSEVAKTLLHFLDDKYDTKKWIVVVAPEIGDVNKVYSVQSAEFHTVSSGGMFVAAISFYPAPELLTKVKARMKDFKFPIESKFQIDSFRFILREKVPARDVYDYLNRFESPLRTDRSESVIESLVIETPCASTEKAFKSFVTIASSNNTGYVALNNKGNCINHLVVIVPVKPFNSTATVAQDLKCYTDVVQNCLLRNEFGQAYLSVLDNSREEAAPIILDNTWTNTTGQRWRFVNNQLVNDHGKCLTAWQLTSTYLYQYDCHIDWMGQIWYRHGLNIVNGFNLCLAYTSSPNDPVMYLVQGQCDSTPPYLWYDWDTDCEEKMVIPSIGNESRPLKNEFTKRYLTVYSDSSYALNEPWNNEAGQNWKFVNNQLQNDKGNCLLGEGWYIKKVDCISDTDLTIMWNYNEKRQIVNNSSGYCLSAGDQNGYIQQNYCGDGPEYLWL